MKWLELNELIYPGVTYEIESIPRERTRTVVINPSMIVMVSPCRQGTEIYFMDEGMITVVETLEEVMALLGNECDWRMP